jgi:hypothetical protein
MVAVPLLTLLVSVVASIMVFFLSPVHGLIVYLTVFVYYPSYFSVPVGTIDFTVCRIIILAILAKLFLQTDLPGRFRFVWLDKLVIIYFAAQILAGVTTAQSLMAFLENRGGAVFDMVLSYFAVRLIIINKDRYLILLKGILFSAAPLAIFGFYQCLTSRNLLDFIPGQRYSELPMRFGFYRAALTFSHSIMFGLYFAMLGPACAGLWYSIRKNRWLYTIAISLMALGVFSSMSSGPFLAAILAILFIAFYRFRRYWKAATVIVVVMCGAVEIISNRHFYDVMGDFTFSSQTAWYRSRLIDVALTRGGMAGHWLTGFGEVDPGWGPIIDGRDHTDIVNQYLLVLSSYGLVGFIPFIAVIVAALKSIFEVLRADKSDLDTWLTWCLLGTLLGLLCAFMSVSLFDQPTTVFFVILGFVGSLPLITYENSSLGKLSEAVKWCHIEKPQTVNILHQVFP